MKTPTFASLVQLQLPKTTFTSPTFSLAAQLKAMGMPLAFDATNADFTGLCASNPYNATLYVSDVLQKANIAVQETGVEAAGATAVILAADAGIELPDAAPVVIPMNVNQPYMVTIVDDTTGAILYLGHIEDPTDAGSP